MGGRLEGRVAIVTGGAGGGSGSASRNASSNRAPRSRSPMLTVGRGGRRRGGPHGGDRRHGRCRRRDAAGVGRGARRHGGAGSRAPRCDGRQHGHRGRRAVSRTDRRALGSRHRGQPARCVPVQPGRRAASRRARCGRLDHQPYASSGGESQPDHRGVQRVEGRRGEPHAQRRRRARRVRCARPTRSDPATSNRR